METGDRGSKEQPSACRFSPDCIVTVGGSCPLPVHFLYLLGEKKSLKREFSYNREGNNTFTQVEKRVKKKKKVSSSMREMQSHSRGFPAKME
jgi:hypothetical protein